MWMDALRLSRRSVSVRPVVTRCFVSTDGRGRSFEQRGLPREYWELTFASALGKRTCAVAAMGDGC